MKQTVYEAPVMQVLRFDAKDIITTSGFPGSELPLRPKSMSDASEEIF